MTIIVALILIAFLASTVWTVVNAFRYWKGRPKLTVMDHILLAFGVLNGVLLSGLVFAFIYYS